MYGEIFYGKSTINILDSPTGVAVIRFLFSIFFCLCAVCPLFSPFYHFGSVIES